MPDITLYTTRSCPYCKMTRQFLQEHNIEYTDIDVTDDAAAQEEMIDKAHQRAVPVVDIDGQIVVGFDEERLSELLGLS